MRNIFVILLTTLMILPAGCYPNITGTVIDAETGQPIEGAVVLVQWTKTHGFGLTYHTVYKVLETETNKMGKFSITGAYSPFIDKPTLVIYKKGYIAWRNDILFPNFIKRTDYDTWKNNYEYKLDKFKEGYPKDKHQMFMGHGIMIDGLNKVPKFHKVLNDE